MKIEIKDLTHVYDVQVLNKLNLTLENYNSIAILGVSGSGKSTLLRILSGLEKPSLGEVLINGKSVKDDSYKKTVGFVFQSHNLFPHLTLLNNITLILEKTRGIGKIEAKETALANLRRLQLEDQAHKLPKNVSGGQAQRASIARALSVNPDIIFLDEPTSSLDPILTHEVLTAVEDLRDLGKSFIFVTHVISFVKDFADYVIFMHQGDIVEQGPPSILENPKSQAMKDFMHKVR
ncbi:amino acid ABC transporter ATP-binding protein [Liberiplasma polymorphum]|jgi:ABC-type polar amino acid transport system ATPase subunit|uniref:amino acid ABC transporter ATP-binding protein n=1 Tax=Liberiplasma polymorphum TaxID=3374570 RepID=UPI0037737FFB